MITTDREDRILAWSASAQKLLGFPPEKMLGRPFFEAVGARDLFGNRLCGRACGYHEMVRDGEPVHTFEMQVVNAAGSAVRTFVSIAPEGGRRRAGRLVYHLRADLRREGDRRREIDRRRLRGVDLQVDAAPTREENPWGLSARETQVLRCLAKGGNTQEIAAYLGISPTTVRNHVQRLLRKLGVHRRIEALTLAYRHRIL